jgi:hypothetical protein
MARLSRALKASEGAEPVYLFVFGDQAPRLHLIPRYPVSLLDFAANTEIEQDMQTLLTFQVIYQ